LAAPFCVRFSEWFGRLLSDPASGIFQTGKVETEQAHSSALLHRLAANEKAGRHNGNQP